MLRLKKSIRLKSILLFTMIITLMTIMLFIANVSLLQKYYIKKSMKKLDKISSEIVVNYQKMNLFDQQYIFQLEENYNIRVNIIPFERILFNKENIKNKNKFNSTSSFFKSLTKKDIASLNSGEKIIRIIKHNRFRGHFIALAYKIPNEDRLIILSSPIAQIKEAVSAASEFLLMASSITLLLGSIAVYFSAKKISNPIIKINSVAKSMASLDFTKKISLNTNDELQELAENINFLSSELEGTITNLNLANQKLLIEIEKERKIEKMRKIFISNISHELKTPIAVIGGYAEALSDNIIQNNENRIFYSSTILKESEKMAKIVNELLLISKLESDTFSFQMEIFNMSESVETILKKFTLHLKKKNISIVKNFQTSLSAYGNKEKIESCIENLLSNSISFVNENGIISITLKQTLVSTLFEITNSGEQIPEDKIDNIWLAFYRADEARSRDLGGTGLGLSIIKSIIDKHNGRYGCKNLEKGVLFWFELFSK